MKKAIFSLLLLAGGINYTLATPVDLSVSISDHTGTAPGHPKTSIPSIDLTDGVLTFHSNHADFALQILDEDGVVVYSVAVPSTQTTVVLPSWLNGEYELRLYPTGSNIYFYGYIEL